MKTACCIVSLCLVFRLMFVFPVLLVCRAVLVRDMLVYVYSTKVRAQGTRGVLYAHVYYIMYRK